MFVVLALQLIAGLLAYDIYDIGPKEDKYPFPFPGVPPSSRVLLNAQQCKNMAAFAVTGAIEIATQRLYKQGAIERDVEKMSEQEIVDCYYASCNAADPVHLLKWMGLHGRLSSAENYWPFLGDMKVTKELEAAPGTSECRAARAPNDLQVNFNKLVLTVKLEEIDYYIDTVGFVFARMVLDHENCPEYFIRNSTYYEKTDEILSKYKTDEDGRIGGYDEWLTGEYGHVLEKTEDSGDIVLEGQQVVLIVGTYEDGNGDQYLVVRDSRGPFWMRRGHFLVRRGENTCGIEVSLTTVEYKALKDLGDYDDVTRCPLDYPVWCPDIKTCTREGQSCVADENPDVRDYDPETNAPAYKKDWNFGGRAECEDSPGYEITCGDLAASYKNCFKENIQKMCGGSCVTCALGTCKDLRDDCDRFEKFCKVRAVRAVCPDTCQMHPNDCGTVMNNIYIMAHIQKPPQGPCYAPTVANGVVTNGPMLQYSETLKVECDEGFVLSGEANQCIIQDLYGADSRRLQTCIPSQGTSWGAWEGDGADYTGTQSVAEGDFPCLNTLQIVAEGLFNMDFSDESGEAVMQNPGSYNNAYCRNAGGGAPAPWCFSVKMDSSFYEKSGMRVIVVGSDISLTEIELNRAGQKFCSMTPRCGGDFCANAVDKRYECTDFVKTAATSCTLDYLEGIKSWGKCAGTCCHHGLKCDESEAPAFISGPWTTWKKPDTGPTEPYTGGTGGTTEAQTEEPTTIPW